MNMDRIDYPRMYELRQEAGWTQAETAAYLGCSRSAYGSYERGVRRVPLQVGIALAKRYHVRLDYLVAHTDVREPY